MPASCTSERALKKRGRGLKGARILLLGIAYKENVDDLRESPGLRLSRLLEKAGARVDYHDPYIPRARSGRHGFAKDSVPLTEKTLARADAVLVVTAHSGIDYAWVAENARLVVDTRNAMAHVGAHRDKIVKA